MKISIIIPTWNREKVISRAITSILKQSYQDWELIIVDDGSSDNTEMAVKSFNDHRIIYINEGKNISFLQARNLGIKKASGEWISLLDSDDEYLDGALEKINNTLEKIDDNINIAFFNIIKKEGLNIIKGGFDPNNSNWSKHDLSYEELVLKQKITRDNHRCLRTEFFKNNLYPNSNIGFENLFYANLSKAGKKIVCFNQEVVLVHSDCDMHSKYAIPQWPQEYLIMYTAFLKEHGSVLEKDLNILRSYYRKNILICWKIKKIEIIFWVVKWINVKVKLMFLNF